MVAIPSSPTTSADFRWVPKLGSTGANPVPALGGVILEACHRLKDRSPKTLRVE